MKKKKRIKYFPGAQQSRRAIQPVYIRGFVRSIARANMQAAGFDRMNAVGKKGKSRFASLWREWASKFNVSSRKIGVSKRAL